MMTRDWWNGVAWICDPETAAAMTTADNPVTGYDIGDLLTDINEQMGPAIERTVQRYLPKPVAQDMRKKFVRQVADTIVQYDKQQNK